jgi:hypothetical protein
MAKEKYYLPRGRPYYLEVNITNSQAQPRDRLCFSAAFDKPVYGGGKI